MLAETLLTHSSGTGSSGWEGVDVEVGAAFGESASILKALHSFLGVQLWGVARLVPEQQESWQRSAQAQLKACGQEAGWTWPLPEEVPSLLQAGALELLCEPEPLQGFSIEAQASTLTCV